MKPRPYEKWRPVYGYTGFYEVSNMGRVRGVDRVHVTRNLHGKMKRTLLSQILSQGEMRDGYLGVVLCKDGITKTHRVSRLVLTAFRRRPRKGEEACHRNHQIYDNRLRNLRWGTRISNERDKTRAGRRPTGDWWRERL